MASSSSFQPNAFSEIIPEFNSLQPSPSSKVFDVFINHRGPDVKDTLALQLYKLLDRMGIRAFLDSQELEFGDSVPSTIGNAIRSASVQIAIFSKMYAESPWCLDELDLMLKTSARIIPIFYHVEPSDLRYTEKGVYSDAFSTFVQKGRYLNKIEEWRKVLCSVSFISGYVLTKFNSNCKKLCKEIVYAVHKEVEKRKPLPVAKSPVGLNEIVESFERTCCKKRVDKGGIIGIFGMGGSGKTTLAKELFNRKRSEYNESCFLFNVRETNCISLQSKLLMELFHEKRRFKSIDEGSSYLQHRLARRDRLKFLIVLDDIDHVHQLDDLLVRDMLSPGSLLIVTTRDERVLIRSKISVRYKMKEMNRDHSRKLFCWHAFRQPSPVSDFEDLVESFVTVCGGLPLSLQVLGGLVFASRDRKYWQLQLDKVLKMLPGDIRHKLKISFDSLDSEEKQIFMDIACFFIGIDKQMAIRIWKGSGWSAKHALQTLQDRCLVMFDRVYETKWHAVFKMHDHLRDLGREMAEQMIPPQRLWQPQYHKSLASKPFQNIFMELNGRCFNCISDSFQMTYFFGNSDDSVQTSSTLLSLELSMFKDKHLTIPSWLPLQNLQYLRIKGGCLERLWQSDSQAPSQLKELQLQYTSVEDQFPNSLGVWKKLEDLVLFGMGRQGFEIGQFIVIEGRSLSESLNNLTNLRNLVLTHLSVSGELALNRSRDSPNFKSSMDSLEKIGIRDVEALSKISISGQNCPRLNSLELRDIKHLIEVHFTQNSVELGPCDLAEEGCSEIKELSSLERIQINKCWQLQKITGIEKLRRLKYLYLSAGREAIWGCVEKLQRAPENVIVNGIAAEGAEKKLNAELFSDVIGNNAVVNITENSFKEAVVTLETQSLSAGIICLVIPTSHPMGYMSGIESLTGEYVSTCMAAVQTDSADYKLQKILKYKQIGTKTMFH
ncbi:hypothetical protein SUGI_0670000 [Cryptomeria japonica]|nr:hypothetical protein SUGI_0670000 [Cryptomeria japonica]